MVYCIHSFAVGTAPIRVQFVLEKVRSARTSCDKIHDSQYFMEECNPDLLSIQIYRIQIRRNFRVVPDFSRYYSYHTLVFVCHREKFYIKNSVLQGNDLGCIIIFSKKEVC